MLVPPSQIWRVDASRSFFFFFFKYNWILNIFLSLLNNFLLDKTSYFRSHLGLFSLIWHFVHLLINQNIKLVSLNPTGEYYKCTNSKIQDDTPKGCLNVCAKKNLHSVLLPLLCLSLLRYHWNVTVRLVFILTFW